ASFLVSFFFQAEDGIRAFHVTGVQTCALPIHEKSGVHRIQKRNCEGFSRRCSGRVGERNHKVDEREAAVTKGARSVREAHGLYSGTKTNRNHGRQRRTLRRRNRTSTGGTGRAPF